MASYELSIKLDELINGEFENIINSGLTKAAMIVERDAKIRCPVDDGILRNSIKSEIEPYKATIGTNVEYAPYQECGTGIYAVNGDGRKEVPWVYRTADGEWHSTSGNKPQPFLGPAFEDNRQAILDCFEGII